LCLQKAQDCARLADATSDPLKRVLLSERAARWRRIARDLAHQPDEKRPLSARDRRRPLVDIARHADA
jgi:hypothetical protein